MKHWSINVCSYAPRATSAFRVTWRLFLAHLLDSVEERYVDRCRSLAPSRAEAMRATSVPVRAECCGLQRSRTGTTNGYRPAYTQADPLRETTFLAAGRTRSRAGPRTGHMVWTQARDDDDLQSADPAPPGQGSSLRATYATPPIFQAGCEDRSEAAAGLALSLAVAELRRDNQGCPAA